MKKLDQNQKIVVIALVIFVAFLVGFSVLSSLVQSEIIPDFTASQRVQGILAFFMFLPLCTSMFFAGAIVFDGSIWGIKRCPFL